MENTILIQFPKIYLTRYFFIRNRNKVISLAPINTECRPCTGLKHGNADKEHYTCINVFPGHFSPR